MSKKIYFPMLQEKFEERIALPVPEDQEDDEDDEEETAGSVTNAQPSQPPRMEVAPAEASENAAPPEQKNPLDEVMEQMSN